jgi:hypothetical protein
MLLRFGGEIIDEEAFLVTGFFLLDTFSWRPFWNWFHWNLKFRCGIGNLGAGWDEFVFGTRSRIWCIFHSIAALSLNETRISSKSKNSFPK